MSEVMDVKGNLGGSNQVQNNCLEDATMKSSPLNGSDKNDEHQRIKFKEIKSDMDMAAKAEQWMGVLVTKEFDNKSRMGSVVNYCDETKLFQIEYENDVTEEVDYQELQHIAAPPSLVCEYLERTNPSWYSEMEKEKKKRHQQKDSWVPIHPRYPSTLQQPQQVKPKKRKSKRGTGSGASSTGYIPLAYRETKRDAYIYY